jgi:hypothetical protein
MKKISILFVFALLLMAGTSLKAQPYKTALGLRATYWWGLTVKHNMSDRGAIEGILHTRWGGFILTGLYEHHFPALGVDGLRWYLGGGAHIGFWGNKYNNGNYWFDDNNSSRVGIGFDLIGGLEYTIPSVPINLSIDYKPGFNVYPGAVPYGDDGAFSIRYVF